MIAKTNHVRLLWRHLGPRWLAFRLSHAAKGRLGVIRRQLPATDWLAHPLPVLLADPAMGEPARYLAYRHDRASKFFFRTHDRDHYEALLKAWDVTPETPITHADELAHGTLRYFEHTKASIGNPPDWDANPFSNQHAPADKHWSEIGDFGYGDIKIIWEPSRFAFTYDLVRAYWRTGDESHAERFWQLVEDWRNHNPPQLGPNWKCGQEASFRVMAWCFGLHGFLDSTSSTAERVAALAQMIALSGERIEVNFAYALSQRNNHGMSEALGLWTIGTLFPEFRKAAQWRAKGRTALERQGRELIYDDGAFSQHSFIYQRVMLHGYLWALRLGDIVGQPFTAELKARVGKAAMFLYQLQDRDSGKLPNYGQNDGALVLPLNNCDFQDYRPVIQAVQFYCTGERCYDHGPWDEDLLWFFGPDALDAPIRPQDHRDLQAPIGGYYTLRSETGFASIRCASFKDRPSQADMLHVDLWQRGVNIVIDPGTFSYNAPEPWNNALAGTAYHNTVMVDGMDQMERAGKFLWLPWLDGTVHQNRRSSSGQLAYLEGEHNGYERLKEPVSHRRAVVQLGEGRWLILDRLHSTAKHRYRLHWLFGDFPYTWNQDTAELVLHTAQGPSFIQIGLSNGVGTPALVRADPDSPRGWCSPYYNDRKPALSLDLSAEEQSTLFWTVFSSETTQLTTDAASLSLLADTWDATIRLDSSDTLVSSIVFRGMAEDTLDIL